MNYVIIGNSTAAVACVEGIRATDGDGTITIISDEKHHCYGRPTISYCLMGATSRENMKYRPDDFYVKNKVDLLLGEKAVKIDADGKKVVLASGKSVAYDKLLVATGSRPFVPPMEGLDSVKCAYSFMTYDDMDALDKVLSPKKKVLVIGAGLIGLKCVEGILKRVGSVTVVDLADRILPSILDAEGASVIQRQLEAEGVRFILNNCAARFEGKMAVLKNSGLQIAFDILVIAVGVRPNTELVREAGGEVNRGIVVDTGMRTALKDSYSAGDCAEGLDSSTGTKRILALLPNAYFQGKVAGINMAGGNAEQTNAIPMNAIGFFGSHILTAGVYEGQCISHIEGDKYKKLFVRDGKLCGFILINDFLRAGIYTQLVRDKVDLGSVDFELLKNAPQLLAYPVAARKTKLAKKV